MKDYNEIKKNAANAWTFMEIVFFTNEISP